MMTIAAVPTRETHRHRGDGRCPSGRRSGRWIAINPKGGTHPHVVAHDSVEPSRVGGPTPRPHIAPIASISHPHEFCGCRSATTSPTVEKAAAGGRSANWESTPWAGSDPFARPTSKSVEPTATQAALARNTAHAILRYRLYDIDVVSRKALIVAVLAAVFVLVYALVVGGVGALVQTSNNSALSFAAAVVVAVLFQPVLSRARRFADRVVYGKRASPYEVLSEFGDRLSETYAADDVLPRMARVLAEGVGADRARVWLSAGDELRPVASWPSDADPDRADDSRTEVRHQGELLGALSVAMPPNDPMDPAKEKLVADLAAQAGLVLRNVRLVEDLRGSRRRLVAAQDEERRKLERNIHDGAQQQLVALAVKARLARTLTDRDPAKAEEMLGQMELEMQQALEDLRDLARGIYPPLLADQGLAVALESQARKATIPVEVVPDGVGRYPQTVEAAVYFSVLEALQNVAKYANASHAAVRLGQNGTTLTFEVRDDGAGFDPTSTGYGTGLQGIADRLAALNGVLRVTSAVGFGTTLTGAIPLDQPAG